jgi:hypothetical protein
MRYSGFKSEPRPSKRVEELLEIMKNISTEENRGVIRNVKIDEMTEIPREMCSELPDYRNHRFWTVGVSGGGSCVFHGLLWCINDKYRNMSQSDRFNMVVRLRVELAKNFTPEIYSTINHGHLKDFQNDLDGAYSFNSIKKGLSDYTFWFGLEFLTFIQDQLNVNIHILWVHNGKLNFYKSGSDQSVVSKPGRNSVLLYWHGRNHFQPVGRSVNGQRDSYFVFLQNDMIFSNL